MKERKPLSKKLRFEIFKRDNFSCCYCGANPPSVILEVDHITPVSKGGGNETENLLTSCFDCNRGKSDRVLTSVMPSMEEKHLLSVEKELQYKSYKKHRQAVSNRVKQEVEDIEEVYQMYFPDYYLTDRFKVSIKTFIEKLGYFDVKEAMEKSCTRLDENKSLKYFCGICWNKIKGN